MLQTGSACSTHFTADRREAVRRFDPNLQRVRGLPSEVRLDREHGLDREPVANCDNPATIAKGELISYYGSLGPDELRRLDDALRIALDVD